MDTPSSPASSPVPSEPPSRRSSITPSHIITLRLPPSVLHSVLATPSGSTTPKSTAKKKKGTGLAKSATLAAAAAVGNAPSSPAPFDENQGTPTGRPKPNMTTVNANLKALDRSGIPPRKWVKKPIEFKSFTGVRYTLDLWSGLEKPLSENGPDKAHRSPEPSVTPLQDGSPVKSEK
ncbi:hypothetical protein TRVA0_063S00122 [Trichomonascus vanleenenianus]|uniref:uncharacterized protein n=1 Tax=Trichomonascus vanleenenianus TaxID=2268995 RepID=UPI003EC96BF0